MQRKQGLYARQTACLSNLKQLGLAVMQYYQDADFIAPTALESAPVRLPTE